MKTTRAHKRTNPPAPKRTTPQTPPNVHRLSAAQFRKRALSQLPNDGPTIIDHRNARFAIILRAGALPSLPQLHRYLTAAIRSPYWTPDDPYTP